MTPANFFSSVAGRLPLPVEGRSGGRGGGGVDGRAPRQLEPQLNQQLPELLVLKRAAKKTVVRGFKCGCRVLFVGLGFSLFSSSCVVFGFMCFDVVVCDVFFFWFFFALRLCCLLCLCVCECSLCVCVNMCIYIYT